MNPPRTCPGESELAAYAAGRMPPDDLERLRRHLAECSACRASVAAHSPSPPLGDTHAIRAEAVVSATTPSPTAFEGEGATNESALAPPQGPDEIGRIGGYRVLRKLGEGGMGIVYEAEDPDLQRRVAIKVLKPGMADGATRQRFVREARLAANLPHEHIVTIHQVGEDRGVPFMVMEYLSGESVEDRLQREKWLPVAEALRIGRETAAGLAAVHAAGLVHRDIKPSNVFLQGKVGTATCRVKLLDFGIARPVISGQSLTVDGQIVGTPSYMSPEQVLGQPVDARADLFSLGCLIYHMITGKSPFEKPTAIGALHAVAEGEPTPIAELAPNLPTGLAALIGDLLKKNPNDRPSSARLVLDELKAIEHGKTVMHLVLPQMDTAPIAAQRRRVGLGVWSGAAALILSIVVAVGAFWNRWQNPPEDPSTDASASSGAVVARDDKASADGGARNDSSPLAPNQERPPIKVGLLHSFTGALAVSERGLLEAELLAIDEINAKGGVLGGRRVVGVSADGKSNPLVFAECAEKLIHEDKVSIIFGCWSSSSRKRVEEVCRRHGRMLVYAVSHEGLEQAPNVVYIGAAPNQVMIPAVKFAYAVLKKRRFFLVGSDQIYSRASAAIFSDTIKELKGEVVGEAYVPMGGADFKAIVGDIRATQADCILNTLDGSSNAAFFSQVRADQINAESVPTFSFSVTEREVLELPVDDVEGDFAAWSYYQSIESEQNASFLKRFREKYPTIASVNDPMEATYCGVHLWADALNSAGTEELAKLRAAFHGRSILAPEGRITIDPSNQYATRGCRIARVGANRQVDVQWQSTKPIPPEPFPPSRSRDQWEKLLQQLYETWGQRWEKGKP